MDPKNNKETIRIKELIVGYLTGSLTGEEEKELISALGENPEYRHLLSEFLHAWQIASFAQPQNDNLLKLKWNKLKQRIESSLLAAKFSLHTFLNDKRAVRIALCGVAAGVLLFITFLVLLPKRGNKLPERQDLCFSINTPNGTRSEITLSDGTKVWLNAGSILEYSAAYNVNSREVTLNGEAFFQVATNKKKPFVVKASGLNITAYGTAFNVKAYPEDRTITATLVEGKIKVEGVDREQKRFAYVLEPNQNVVIEKDPLPSGKEQMTGTDKTKPAAGHELVIPVYRKIHLNEQVNTIAYTSWKDKRWVLEKESLRDLVVSLERRYNIKIHFESKELENLNFTGIIQNETFEQVLKILQLTAPICYELSPGEARIYADSVRLSKFRNLMNSSQ